METTKDCLVGRPKDASIEMLKFFAAILIVNSHMGTLYVHFPQLATGGAIGDALFFFCSGYGLFLSKKRSFLNYYKRRICRIYPSVFAWAILSAFVLNEQHDMSFTILHGGGWFVSCIMVYYIFSWFIHRFLLNRLMVVLSTIIVISFAFFIIIDSCNYNIYGDGVARFVFFFGFMLLGGIIGSSKMIMYPTSLNKNVVFFVLSLLCYYGIMIVSTILGLLKQIQFLSVFALGGVTIFALGICNTKELKALYVKYKVFGFVGGLCLEMYIVQFSLFTTKMNFLFPMNLILMLLIVIAVAYILKCCSRVFEQLFHYEDFNWKKILTSK